MCLILFSVGEHPDYPLVVAANRDELYARPALPAHFWTPHSQVLGGRDLEAGGTWMGVTRSGRFAAVTNFANPNDEAPKSRGALVADFLEGNARAVDYVAALDGPSYRGYNLLCWDGNEMVYASNRVTASASGSVLAPGSYALSNAELAADWPKVRLGRQMIQDAVATQADVEGLLQLLTNEHRPPDTELPQRGRPIEMERATATCFIRGEAYGTRAGTALLLGERVVFAEQLYGPGGSPGDRVTHEFFKE